MEYEGKRCGFKYFLLRVPFDGNQMGECFGGHDERTTGGCLEGSAIEEDGVSGRRIFNGDVLPEAFQVLWDGRCDVSVR